MAGRLFLVWGTLLVLTVEVARSEGIYQLTRDGSTIVWNSHPSPGDIATWSGDRDKEGYARGFGRLTWYTKAPGFDKPQLYARYWGRMVAGKLEGPVNVHSKRKTDHAIFIGGARVTGWMAGSASSRATARWSAMVSKRRPNVEPARARELRRGEQEPESPAAGPGGQSAAIKGQRSEPTERIQDLYRERWPWIDIDDSVRILVFPPRSLRRSDQ